MNLGQAWRALGIARTGDASAIRRAYAARLKALDLDADAESYAELRAAREIALRWAANQAAPADREVGPSEASGAESGGDPPGATGAWPYGAPVAAGMDAEAGLIVTVAGALDDPYWPFRPHAGTSGELRDIPLPLGNPFATPPLLTPPDDRTALVQPDRGRDVAFYDLLFPDGRQSDAPFDARELSVARGHFQSLLHQAQGGQLSLYEAIDNWLADTLARAWPRSAPFVADAVTAFGWEQQMGMLGERGAVAFLNARAKGMRFQERVLEPGHTLRNAWLELCRPGSAGYFHRLRMGANEIEQLIAGVRKHFPELEHHWDPQRVASWERAASGGKEAKGPSWWIWGIIIIGIVRILAAIPDFDGPSARSGAPLEAVADSLPADRAALLDEAARAIFGNDVDFGRLQALNPELAGTFRANLPGKKSSEAMGFAQALGPDERFFFTAKMRNLVRDRVYRAAQLTDGAELTAAMQLRLAHLIAARAIDAKACMDIYRLLKVHEAAVLSESTLKAEEEMALKLLRAGRLMPPTPQLPRRASVPGAMIGQVIDETGLPAATVHKAMDHQGSDAVQCAVQIALLRAALKTHGPERTPILHIL